MCFQQRQVFIRFRQIFSELDIIFAECISNAIENIFRFDYNRGCGWLWDQSDKLKQKALRKKKSRM